MNVTDLQRIFLTGYALGLGSGLVLTSFVALSLGRRARYRHRYAMRHIESLSVALRGCAAPRGAPLPPYRPPVPRPAPLRQRPPSLADSVMETQQMPVITSAQAGAVAGW